jgi:hypothetical protein
MEKKKMTTKDKKKGRTKEDNGRKENDNER